VSIDPKRIIVSVGITGTAVVALFLFAQKTPVRATSSPQPTSTANQGQLREVARSSAIAPPAAASSNTASAPINYRQSWRKSRDDWEYAHQLLPDAKAGNPDAQYYLSAILEYCDNIMDLYFTQQGKPLTLDEGLLKAAKVSQLRHDDQVPQAQEGFDRCHRFREQDATDLGNAKDWLDKATRGGQPIAQATTAERRVVQDFMKASVQAGTGRASELAAEPPIGGAIDPRELLRAAVKSLDPQVLETIGGVQLLLNLSNPDSNIEHFAWTYVACQRGLNCSPTSHLARDCPKNCNVSSPASVMMGWSGSDWPAVQQRANEINAKLDAGQWDELGLGP
jgi:hypothetical protein